MRAELPISSVAAPGCGITMSCAPPPGAGAPADPATPAGGASCGPAAAGSTCGSDSGVASQPGQGGMNVGAGNPVNLINGNKYQREADLPPLPGVLGLEIIRHFNSVYATQGTTAGIVGRGWKLSYDTELYAIGRSIQIIQADGNRVIFSRDPNDPSRCASTSPGTGTLRIARAAAGEEYVWTWTNGRVLNFDHRGKLMQITAPGGQFVSLQRDLAGLLLQVTDPQGRKLSLHYPARDSGGFRGVAHIDSPAGRFSYAYGAAAGTSDPALRARQAANLQSVRYPDRIGGRLYHYEDGRHPAFLSGISELQVEAESTDIIPAAASAAVGTVRPAARPERIGTYLYDAQGRAVLTVRGTPARLVSGPDGKPQRPARLVDGTGVGQVTLDYSRPGMTVIANSLGQSTAYRHAIIGGEYRLLEAIGPGCSACGPTNMRFGWRADGLLASVTRLTDSGALPAATTFYEHDLQGRLRAQWHQAYDLRGHPSGPRRLDQRVEYADQTAEPRLIGLPSVVPGVERRIAITYGQTEATRRLPVLIDETGFVPSIDGRTAVGVLSRSIAYAYDARGMRTAVDGPLPNTKDQPSPANSDITRTEHDPVTGLTTRVIAPGNLVTQVVARDAALRPVVIRTTDGVTAQMITFTRNWRGQPLTVRIDAEAVAMTGSPASAASAASTAAKASDAANATPTGPNTAPDGNDPFASVAPGKQSRYLAYRYDTAGRLLAISLPGGLETRFVHDAKRSLIREQLPDGSSRSIRTDTEGRPVETDQDAGVLSAAATDADAPSRYRTAFDYNLSGNLQTRIDADGTRHRQHMDQRGRIDETIDALGISTRIDHDDEDDPVRMLAAAGTPDAAETLVRRDGLGNVVAITDPNGVTTRRWQDDFGRTVAEASPDRGIVLRRHDAAGRLIASIDDTGITTRFAYDNAGRMLSKGIDGEPALARYRYLGMRLQDVTSVASGSGQILQQIRYRYDAMGQVVQTREWMARVDLPTAALKAATTVRPAATATLPGLQFDTFNHWDEVGRLLRQTLPDGHVLRYDYAATAPTSALATNQDAAQAIAVVAAAAGLDTSAEFRAGSQASASSAGARPGQLVAIRFDDRIVIDAIRQDGIAATGAILGYTHGNGVRRSIGLDTAGRVTRLTDSLGADHAVRSTASDTGSRWSPNGAAWFASPPARSKILYQQVGQHDANGRLVSLQRQQSDPQGGVRPVNRVERYGYDRLDRLTRIDDGHGEPTVLSYDRGGNRIAKRDDTGLQHYRYAPGTNRLIAVTNAGINAGTNAGINAGTNAVIKSEASAHASTLPVSASAGAKPGRLPEARDNVASAWLFHPTGLPVAQFDFGPGRTGNKLAVGTGSGPDSQEGNPATAEAFDARRTLYNTAHRPIAVVDASNRPIARYYYNVFGERVAKTVYRRMPTPSVPAALKLPVSMPVPETPKPEASTRPAKQTGSADTEIATDEAGTTTYSLYRDQRLAAQTDVDGHIVAHYIYLDGKPIAKVAMQPTPPGWQRILKPVRRLFAGTAPSQPMPSDASADVYAIHTDHLGTPQVVSDANQKIVWQADTTPFGQARLLKTASASRAGPAFTMDLRLPGQVFDAETGLHYNYQRDYDPALGRYLTPDPIGLAGGLQPYGYVGGNPLNLTDRLGLYEEDIHYYMTYFLARAAGVDARLAYIIATADQFVDNNPRTTPTRSSYAKSLYFITTDNAAQREILAAYHFTQTPQDDETSNPATRYKTPYNKQLGNLSKAADDARQLGGECAYAVMYGEYLHAFEDTFAHRSFDNTPIAINSGFGHTTAGTFPDHTFNENAVLGHDWIYNEARTLTMEREVYTKLLQFATSSSTIHGWAEIEPLLSGPDGFNARKEDGEHFSNFDGTIFSTKVAMLNSKLKQWGYEFINTKSESLPLSLSVADHGLYSPSQGQTDRDRYLRYLETTSNHRAGDRFKQSDFPGTLLNR